MLRRIRTFLFLSPARQLLVLHIWWLLAGFRLALLLIPFRRLAPRLEGPLARTDPAAVDACGAARARVLGHLVAQVAHHTPWRSSCLVQVLVLQRLLRDRGIAGRLYLGVRRPDLESGATAIAGVTPELAGHAWMECGGYVVNGARNYRDYRVIATFRW
jgi:hypothetical protein